MKFLICLLALTIAGANAGLILRGGLGGYGGSVLGGGYGGVSRVVRVIDEPIVQHVVPTIQHVVPSIRHVQPILQHVTPIIHHHSEPVSVVRVINDGHIGGWHSGLHSGSVGVVQYAPAHGGWWKK